MSVTTIEVPGLADALNRPAVALDLRLIRLNGVVLEARALIPDEPAALGLKAFAWQSRAAGKDAVDLWRCLEVARAAGVQPDDVAEGRLPEAIAIVRAGFRRPDGPALRAAAKHRGMSAQATTTFATRIAALIESVAGPIAG